MSEPRDWWSKAEIITKIISSIAAVFLPVALLMVGNQLTDQQKKSICKLSIDNPVDCGRAPSGEKRAVEGARVT